MPCGGPDPSPLCRPATLAGPLHVCPGVQQPASLRAHGDCWPHVVRGSVGLKWSLPCTVHWSSLPPPSVTFLVTLGAGGLAGGLMAVSADGGPGG